MPLKKTSGNMYDWVSHTHSHLGGECPHRCIYCYVQKNRFGVHPRYQGEPRLIEKEFLVKYGEDNVIFIEHMQDIFALGIEPNHVERILKHCNEYPDNTYVFQTKHPEQAFDFYRRGLFPAFFIMGTTIETNRAMPTISEAPPPIPRFAGIKLFKQLGIKVFVTIEPIMDFDDEFIDWLIDLKPDFINIGADSKACKLPEPSKEKIEKLIRELKYNNIEIRKKVNLKRLGIEIPIK